MTKQKRVKYLLCICMAFALLSSITAPILFASALTDGQAFVVAYECNLYSAPDPTSATIKTTDAGGQMIDVILKQNDVVTIGEIQEDFAFVTTQSQHQGWVYKFYLTQNENYDVYPVFNGTIIKDTIVYQADKTTPVANIMKGTRVYLFEGFDKENDFTAIQYTGEDTSIQIGYIATSDVEPDGISKTLIVAITIIIAAATIVLSLVFMKKKRKKKKEKKLKI